MESEVNCCKGQQLHWLGKFEKIPQNNYGWIDKSLVDLNSFTQKVKKNLRFNDDLNYFIDFAEFRFTKTTDRAIAPDFYALQNRMKFESFQMKVSPFKPTAKIY